MKPYQKYFRNKMVIWDLAKRLYIGKRPSPAQNNPGESAISDPKIWFLQAGNSKLKNGKSIYGY